MLASTVLVGVVNLSVCSLEFHFGSFILGFQKSDLVNVNRFFCDDKFFHYGVRGRFFDM